MKQTVESLMKSFQISRKKHIFITGARGIGKTTLFEQLKVFLNINKSEFPGITTYAIPKKCVILKDNLTGKEMEIGRFILQEDKEEMMMQPISEGFKKLGIQALTRALQSDSVWASIDEIGYLESGDIEFQNAIRNILDKKHVLAVLRKQNIPFLNELKSREDVYIIDLDEFRAKVGCVIMASGLGKRFGSNKLLAKFKGKTLLEITLDLTGDRLFAKRIVVTRSKEVAELCKKKNVDVILHSMPNRNDTVRLGIQAMEDMEGCMFCPCDQPLLKRESLKKAIDMFKREDGRILRFACGKNYGTPILFHSKYFKELKNLPEKAGGSYLVKKYPEKVKPILVEEKELFDIDTKKDLEILSKL